MPLPGRRHLLALPLAALLFGCAGPPPPATVQVFTPPMQLPAGATYRHERLPSQAAQPRQAELEATADALLARAGLRRNDAAPRYALQVAVGQDQFATPPYWNGSSVGVGVAGGGHGGGIGIGLGFPIGVGGGVQTTQRVDVVLRDLGSGQVVYQSRASGSSGASPAALLQAALSGFPTAGPGTRQVPLANAATG